MPGEAPHAREKLTAVPSPDLLATHWHTLDIQAALDKLGSTEKGLKTKQRIPKMRSG